MTHLVLAFVLCGASAPAVQSPPTADRAHERIAAGRARDTLRRVVLAAHTDDAVTLQQWTSEHGVSEAEIDSLLDQAARVGEPRRYRDGTMEVFLSLPAGSISAAMTRWSRPAGDSRSAPPPASAPAASSAVAEADPDRFVGGCFRPAPPTESTGDPAPVAGRSLALMAARLDAELGLLRQIRRLRLSPTVAIQDLIAEQPELAWSLRRWPEARAATAVHAADGACHLSLELRWTDLAERLRPLLTSDYRGALVEPAAAARLAEYNSGAGITARGAGRPPPAGAESQGDGEPPRWVDDCLVVQGAALPPAASAAGDTATRSAPNPARRDAEYKLSRAIDDLPLPGGARLADVIAVRPELAESIEEFVRAAHADRSVDPDGAARVTLRRPLQRLWMLVSEREPQRATAMPAPSPAAPDVSRIGP